VKARLTEAWIAITADKRKAVVLGALTLVALVTVTRAALSQKKPAGLRPVAGASAPAAADAAAGLVRAENRESRTEAPVVRLAAIPPLTRNLFLASERHFPYPAQTEGSGGTPAKSPVGTDEKSEEEIERALAEERVRLVNEEAAGLRLRSTMLGTSPLAVVESAKGARGGSAVLRVGQAFEGFTLVEVHRESAILEKDGVRVEIRLPLP
jgi:hypothetical protein